MPDVYGLLSRLLGGGDPEAQGAAQASTAMQPQVLDYAQRVLSGQIAREGVLGQPRPYDPALSYRQNVPDTRASLEPAIDVAMGIGPGAIRAFHGSPFDFSRFDMSKIGTGEGAQAYGHGLYFAESEPVARSYRDALAKSDYSLTGAEGRVPDWLGNQIAQYPAGHEYYNSTIDRGIAEFRKRLAETQAEVKTHQQPWLLEDNITGFNQIIDSLQKLRSGEATLAPRGRMYEVNIDADPQRLLDWDKPLAAQSPAIREFAAANRIPEVLNEYQHSWPGRGDMPVTGREAYERVKGRLQGEYPGATKGYMPPPDYNAASLASQQMRESGIPGIRYLDQGSRSGGQGTSNYVVFDDKLIDILRKYGIVPPLAGAGALATGSEPPT